MGSDIQLLKVWQISKIGEKHEILDSIPWVGAPKSVHQIEMRVCNKSGFSHSGSFGNQSENSQALFYIITFRYTPMPSRSGPTRRPHHKPAAARPGIWLLAGCPAEERRIHDERRLIFLRVKMFREIF